MIFFALFFFQLLVLYLFSKALTRNLSQLFFNITNNNQASGYILAVLFLPGTIAHEFFHYLMAVLVRVPVKRFNLLPKIGSDQIILGSMGILQSDPLRRFLIGVAPFLFGTILLLGGISWFFNQNISQNLPLSFALGYLMFTVSNTMFSSKKDMEGALGLFIIILLIVIPIFFLSRFLPSVNINFSPLTGVFKKLDYVLLIPLVVDMIILVLVKLALRLKK